MLCTSYDSKILHEEFHWIYLPGEIKLLLVTVNNRLILEIEIVHYLSCHPIVLLSGCLGYCVVLWLWFCLVLSISVKWLVEKAGHFAPVKILAGKIVSKITNPSKLLQLSLHILGQTRPIYRVHNQHGYTFGNSTYGSRVHCISTYACIATVRPMSDMQQSWVTLSCNFWHHKLPNFLTSRATKLLDRNRIYSMAIFLSVAELWLVSCLFTC